ncbi:MAG: hypothetical protein IJX63_03940 [Lachnospiraceae bacterium]|nr:hypothetical protein [Lachnospiraceae bacterium]
MKEDFKLCFKLIKYSYNYKDETITSILFFVIGIILFLAGSIGDSVAIGPSLMIVMAPSMFVRALDSLSYSYMVCSSKKRKLLEQTFRNVWTIAGTAFGCMSWILLTYGILLLNSPEREAEIAGAMIWSSLLHIAMFLFMGVYTKYYWQGVAIMGVAAMAIILFSTIWDEGFAGFTQFGPAAVTGFIITMAGALLSCVLRVLVYKKPVVRGRVGKQMLGVQ